MASNTLEDPNNHGRSGSNTTLKLAVPAAAAIPNGRQQVNVERAPTAATKGAIFSECFILPSIRYGPALLPHELLRASFRAMEYLVAYPQQGTFGRIARD
jgi:hypothetical protein